MARMMAAFRDAALGCCEMLMFDPLFIHFSSLVSMPNLAGAAAMVFANALLKSAVRLACSPRAAAQVTFYHACLTIAAAGVRP